MFWDGMCLHARDVSSDPTEQPDANEREENPADQARGSVIGLSVGPTLCVVTRRGSAGNAMVSRPEKVAQCYHKETLLLHQEYLHAFGSKCTGWQGKNRRKKHSVGGRRICQVVSGSACAGKVEVGSHPGRFFVHVQGDRFPGCMFLSGCAVRVPLQSGEWWARKARL